jgi:hypothetical protein
MLFLDLTYWLMATKITVFCWSECFIVQFTSEFAHFKTERMYLQWEFPYNQMSFMQVICKIMQ